MAKKGVNKEGGGLGDYISISQAARLRGVSPQAIDDLIRRGRLTAYPVAGRRLLLRSEVEAFERESGGRGRKAGS